MDYTHTSLQPFFSALLTKDKLRRMVGKLGERREENRRALFLALCRKRNNDDDDDDDSISLFSKHQFHL